MASVRRDPDAVGVFFNFAAILADAAVAAFAALEVRNGLQQWTP